MVFLNEQAFEDLRSIFDGLLHWTTLNGENRMSYEEVVDYYEDLIYQCYTLDSLSYHAKATYLIHQQYGKYVYCYNRNSRTTWYLIYEKDEDIIYINKIINNHLTYM